jgi:hypothetical protein
LARHRLKDDGYSSYRKIMRDGKEVGRVHKNADGSFTGIIGRVQVPGSSWEDAMNKVVAEVERIPVSELVNRGLVSAAKGQKHTQAILIWLTNHAESNAGHLHFTNTDLAQAAGWPAPNQALGNLVSRLDLCCCMAGLPSIGCAAERTFDRAWSRPGPDRVQFDWDFPVELMQRRAKSHHWTRDDFARLQRESLGLLTGSAPKAWDTYMIKHEARVKEWAYHQEEEAA